MVHNPSGPLKSGIPDSVEIPAPVKTRMREAGRRAATADPIEGCGLTKRLLPSISANVPGAVGTVVRVTGSYAMWPSWLRAVCVGVGTLVVLLVVEYLGLTDQGLVPALTFSVVFALVWGVLDARRGRRESVGPPGPR